MNFMELQILLPKKYRKLSFHRLPTFARLTRLYQTRLKAMLR
jgi:hypothetical protein